MIRYSRRLHLFAAVLAAIAGFVDAVGFLALGGFFVSFMSGNTTRLAVGLATGSKAAAVAGGLIALFVAGVMLGSLVGHAAGPRRRPVVLALVALLLTFAAAVGMAHMATASIIAMALAMGAENTVFEKDGEVQIGLTYMTGTLVKLGQRLTAALLGGARWEWLPYLGLWLGLAAGAVAGASAYPVLGLGALWIAAVAAAGCAAVAART